jgi:Kef-type K+ transport system membrane component KefB
MNLFSFVSENPFYEFTLILFFAALLGGLGQVLRQPLIVMFIALGILIGPSVLNIVTSKENINLLAEVGIAILLFIVGLKLDLRVIKSVGRIALVTGMGQIMLTALIGYFIGLGLGFSSPHSFYLAVALTFSSTIIIVKLLSDKKEIDSLHGKISIGLLIIQDIVVILLMIVLSTMRQHSEASLLADIGRTLLSGGILLVLTIAVMKWILPGLSYFLARSQEMLTLFAIAWSVSLASVGELMGLTGEVGAFLAGVSLASSQFKDVISSRLTSLRDFLLLFFFVNLGANLNLSVIGSQIPAALVFSVFVLVGKPLIVMIIMGLMGYRKRTSFLAGLTMAQISEFSLIFAGLGLAVGHIDEETVGLITLVGLITIGLSTYLIIYSHQIYHFISPALEAFERKTPYREISMETGEENHIDLIIFGFGRFGSRIAEMLQEYQEIRYLAVDFDPQVIKLWQEKGRNIIYGDLEDPEILERIPVQKAKYIISTVPDREASIQLIRALKRNHYPGKIFQIALHEKDARLFSYCGADQVLIPHQLAATSFYNSLLIRLFESDNMHQA